MLFLSLALSLSVFSLSLFSLTFSHIFFHSLFLLSIPLFLSLYLVVSLSLVFPSHSFLYFLLSFFQFLCLSLFFFLSLILSLFSLFFFLSLILSLFLTFFLSFSHSLFLCLTLYWFCCKSSEWSMKREQIHKRKSQRLGDLCSTYDFLTLSKKFEMIIKLQQLSECHFCCIELNDILK